MSIPVLTVHSRDPRAFEYYYRPWAFTKSLERLGVTPVILAHNDPSYNGLMSKPFFYRNWMRQHPSTEHIIITDCWDVIFTEHPDSLAARCKALYGDAVVFNGEKGCWPRADLAEHFPDHGTPWRYLNSGFICGPADRVLAMLEAMNIEDIGFDREGENGARIEPNDQGEFQRMFVYQPVKMVVDGRCELAQTYSGCDPSEFEFSSTGVRNKITGTVPGVQHGNGDGKQHAMPLIIAALRL